MINTCISLQLLVVPVMLVVQVNEVFILVNCAVSVFVDFFEELSNVPRVGTIDQIQKIFVGSDKSVLVRIVVDKVDVKHSLILLTTKHSVEFLLAKVFVKLTSVRFLESRCRRKRERKSKRRCSSSSVSKLHSCIFAVLGL